MAELPSSLPGIDVASALARVGGNQNLYIKLLRRVAAESASTKEQLSTAIMEGNVDQVREIAHSIKGAAANLSMTEVAAVAEKLEEAAKAGDASMVEAHQRIFESALDAFVGVVNTLEGL